MIQGELTFGSTNAETNSVEYLRDLGYLVLPPSKFIKNKIEEYSFITSADALVEFFYSRMEVYKPGRHIHYTRSSTDHKIAGDLIKSRMSSGIKRRRAIAECACIIDTLLKHEDIFGLSTPISSMKIVSFKWLTDHVISFINKERSIEVDLVERMEMEEMIRQLGEE